MEIVASQTKGLSARIANYDVIHQATNQRQLYERMAQSIASMPISPRHLLGICYFVLEKLLMPHGGADLVHFVLLSFNSKELRKHG